MVRLTATEVARDLSRVLSRVASGEEIEVVRNGIAVAQMLPARRQLASADNWRALVETAPDVDADFGRDIESARRELGAPSPAWPS